jgi:hypothetical protein
MTKSEVSKLVYMLFSAYHSKEPQDATIELYEQLLLDLPAEPAKAAVLRLLQTSRFRPTIAEVREAALLVESGPKRTGIEAWGDVTRAIRYVGVYRVPKFQDPLVQQLVEAIGWREVCLGDNEAALRARFCEGYNASSALSRSERAVSPSLRLNAAEGNVAQLVAGVGRVL